MYNDSLTHRQWEIVNLLCNYKSMSVDDLAAHFGVTTTTIRRELSLLEQMDMVVRSRGYAHLKDVPNVSPFEARCQMHAQEKKLLAKRAMQYIQPSDTILMDGGSTVYALAKEITVSNMPDLAVITNSLPIAQTLAGHCLTISTGGTVEVNTMSLVGPNTEAAIDSVVANKLFLGATGINLSLGLTVNSQLCLGVKKRMMEHATERIVLLDSKKWMSSGMNIFCKLDEVDRIITIRNSENSEKIAVLQQRGVCLDCVDME